MNYSFRHDITDGGSSIRSSDDGASGSPCRDTSERRLRLETKIENLKMKISKMNVDCEADVEHFLQMSREMEQSRGLDNPQMARIKQNFEKSNRRNTQDLESLQKKLANYEQKLRDLDTGNPLETSRSGNIVSTVGHGIRRTGANIKGLTGTVISAPLDLGRMIRNSFGSADNIQDHLKADASNVGQSTFYASSETAVPPVTATPVSKASTLPPGIRMGLDGTPLNATSTPEKVERPPPFRPPVFSAASSGDSDGGSESRLNNIQIPPGQNAEVMQQLVEELKLTREQNVQLADQFSRLTEYVQKELKFFEKTFQEDRFKFQKLEDQLNETIDLHQAEVKVVRQDLSTIANRIDYQYNDRFKRVEESVESAHNQVSMIMFRMEASLKESMDMRFQGNGWWNTALLSGANILVELLKLILFIVAVVLDFFKPFTGTRTKTGLFLFVVTLIVIVFQNVDFISLFRYLFTSNKRGVPNATGDL